MEIFKREIGDKRVVISSDLHLERFTVSINFLYNPYVLIQMRHKGEGITLLIRDYCLHKYVCELSIIILCLLNIFSQLFSIKKTTLAICDFYMQIINIRLGVSFI